MCVRGRKDRRVVDGGGLQRKNHDLNDSGQVSQSADRGRLLREDLIGGHAMVTVDRGLPLNDSFSVAADTAGDQHPDMAVADTAAADDRKTAAVVVIPAVLQSASPPISRPTSDPPPLALSSAAAYGTRQAIRCSSRLLQMSASHVSCCLTIRWLDDVRAGRPSQDGETANARTGPIDLVSFGSRTRGLGDPSA